nr:hypothetical protein CFP56_27664 [Quercus suber]
MDQIVLESLQHLRLTKEEEEDIALSTRSRSDLMEECALSLFGKLLSDRQQNQKALKSTLRIAWKMGSELRIVDVGKDILQFKFNSEYQMEWVERNGPWNFDNNLLLLCRWKKGLSVSNISFTHSPFWVQVWGLPFENLSEEVGKDLGGNLKEYSERSRASGSRNQDDDRRRNPSDGLGEKSVPVSASGADVESVQRVNLNFQNLRQNGQDVAPEKWGKSEGSSTKVEKNLENRFGAEISDLGAQMSNLPHELHVEMDSGKGPSEAYSLVGFLNSSANEAHEITSPLKATGDIPNPLMKPVTLASPKKETQPRVKVNLKRNACEKRKTSPDYSNKNLGKTLWL